MKKIENKEVEQYIKKDIASILESCEIFRKVYGKGFVERRLNQNLKKVFTNQFDPIVDGYFDSTKGELTICTKNTNDPTLSKEYIENDDEIKFAVLHETIHTILKKTALERLLLGIKNGSTGLLEIYSEGKELGRGLNEGLTNWICNKASGLSSSSYQKLTTLIYELELAIGEENVMRLGKGDINKNVSKQLGMSKEQTLVFLAKTDLIDMLELQIYKLKDKNETDKTNNKSLTEKLENLVEDLESTIFEKYFKKDFYEMISKKSIPDKEFERFKSLKNLIITNKYKSIKNEQSESAIKDFLKDFSLFKDIYTQNTLKSTQKDLLEGKFTLEKFKSKVEALYDDDFLPHYIDFISLGIGKNNFEDTKILLDYLVKSKNLDGIGEFSITHASINNKKIPIILRYGIPVSTKQEFSEKSFMATDEISNKFEDEFDFTLERNEDEQNIIKQFIQLKVQIERNNPDAEIKIIDRYIYVQSDFDLSLYIIQDGEILPAKFSQQEPLKIEFQNENNQLVPVKLKKLSILQKFTTGIRQMFSKNKNTNIPIVVNLKHNPKNENSEFRRSLKFEGENQETGTQQNPNSTIQQKHNEGR